MTYPPGRARAGASDCNDVPDIRAARCARSAKSVRSTKSARRLKAARGISRFELLNVVFVIGVLCVVLLSQLLHYQELARIAVMEMTVANVRSGLRLRVAELIMSNRLDQLGGLLQQNPVIWLDAPPANYLGEYDHPQLPMLPGDSWLYDRHAGELIYLSAPGSASDATRTALHLKVVARAAHSEAGRFAAEGVALTTYRATE